MMLSPSFLTCAHHTLKRARALSQALTDCVALQQRQIARSGQDAARFSGWIIHIWLQMDGLSPHDQKRYDGANK
ncbi:MAG: hypothetical protein MRY63_11435 [Neomegalonema sp.]|nr:hypothetical protein [Neomegalonema sp.]